MPVSSFTNNESGQTSGTRSAPLTAIELLALGDIPPKEITLGGLGSVLVGQMSTGDREALESHRKDGVIPDYRGRHMQKVLFNPDGTRMFTEGDIPRLAKLPEAVWDRIYEASTSLNGVGDKALEAAVGE